MRNLTEHQVNPANDKLHIAVMDEPGHGNACHSYVIGGFDASNNQSRLSFASMSEVHILFQNGPIAADGNGVNGVTHEALLAILCDRLRGFQNGPYACKANACALTHLEEAMHWLQQRTLERMRRGVEGTHAV